MEFQPLVLKGGLATDRLPVCIIGAGYVGLSTGLVMAYLGHRVVFVEHDPHRLAMLQKLEVPFYEPHLAQLLRLTSEQISFTQQVEVAVPASRLIFWAVGTPSLPNGQADLSALLEAAHQVGSHLHPDYPTLIVNKSTAPVGTLHRLAQLIDQVAKGRPYALANSPEFLREGQALFDSFYPSRLLVGSFHPDQARLLVEAVHPLIEQSFEPPSFLPRPPGLQQIPLMITSPATAELAKYASNAFLATKISFINEMARLAEVTGAQIDQVAQVMGQDPRIGPDFLRAGLGWGGSCLGKDTAGLLELALQHQLDLPLVAAARQINREQPQQVINHLEQLIGPLQDRRIGLLGLAFKPQTDDLRDAPSLELMRRLKAQGAQVRVHDPVVHREFEGVATATTELELASQCDALVLVTEWPQYLQLDWGQLGRQMKHPTLVDARNALDGPTLHALGFTYRSIGRPVQQ
jgi:UDPglucose 6-dehydrogenase